ncbi:MAG TPA: putative DNA modification/repair radical SAM protein [Ruminococcaceae bacterium]|nr:putative DNA modification/repair radical SAM protein [Oscillospiraceae bacterium]HCA28981.1 putative DNA modification/repair radical SAM protein [Oscillospiraceae bacterium]
MDLMEKLSILTDSAKYDVACTSSGSNRSGIKGAIGSACLPGICHSFAADGRCISLLKVLMTNICIYDCQYCVNRRSNDVPRATFTPDELASLTMEFYRRNYIEGLFLSSGVMQSPDTSMERMCRVLMLLRTKYRFNGYIHAKAIPGCSGELVQRLGTLCDRLSINIELPSEKSLNILAPDKTKENIIKPMSIIRDTLTQNKQELAVYRHASAFAPAGQSTQMIIGATPDTDWQILRLSESLYKKYSLKRVFYSAYIPVGNHSLLPKDQPPPLLREHRLYQADWLLRFYGFKAGELLDDKQPSLDPLLDPKCNWALGHLETFPVEVNSADKELLLRVPGIGPQSAMRILTARRAGLLSFDDLKKIGVVMKRAAYFITCKGKMFPGTRLTHSFIYENLTADTRRNSKGLPFSPETEQLSFFSIPSVPMLSTVNSRGGDGEWQKPSM